jgi:membrane fusion protein, multidrug efflux system
MNNISRICTFLLLTIIFASCGEQEVKTKSAATVQATVYKIMPLQPTRISGKVQLPGVMQPFQFVQLYPRISGFIKYVAVDRGSTVKKGQVLLTLEAPEVEQQVASAKLKYTQAQASYITSKDRYRRLRETSVTPGTVSPFDLEAAASKMLGDSATAQGEYANYRAQETMRSYLTITAPFDGIITERNVHPGALAGPGAQNAKPMLVLQQLSRLRLVVDIPEQYATQVKNGDIVHYKSNAIPGAAYTGTISRSSQSLSNSYRSETIEIDIDNKDHRFKPGMYAEVVLPTSGSANAFVVPASAIVTTTERKYVIQVEDGKARLTDITAGNQNNDSTEIFGNLKSGGEVIVNADYQVKEGQAVK